MLTFLEMPYAYSAWIQRWGLSGDFVDFYGKSDARLPGLSPELMNQWFCS